MLGVQVESSHKVEVLWTPILEIIKKTVVTSVALRGDLRIGSNHVQSGVLKEALTEFTVFLRGYCISSKLKGITLSYSTPHARIANQDW